MTLLVKVLTGAWLKAWLPVSAWPLRWSWGWHRRGNERSEQGLCTTNRVSFLKTREAIRYVFGILPAICCAKPRTGKAEGFQHSSLLRPSPDAQL